MWKHTVTYKLIQFFPGSPLVKIIIKAKCWSSTYNCGCFSMPSALTVMAVSFWSFGLVLGLVQPMFFTWAKRFTRFSKDIFIPPEPEFLSLIHFPGHDYRLYAHYECNLKAWTTEDSLVHQGCVCVRSINNWGGTSQVTSRPCVSAVMDGLVVSINPFTP